ncbi:TPA: LytR/AlgR family response regulator transcription factor [Streptococcus suis]
MLVDDEMIQLNNLTKMVKEAAKHIGINVTIQTYTSGESFLFDLEDHPEWELAFLDIEMKELSGMDVATFLYEKSAQIQVVFATGFAEYAIEGYRVNALDYLLKPITKDGIIRSLIKYLEQRPNEIKKLLIKDDKRQSISMSYDEIIYLEAYGKEIIIYSNNEAVKTRASLSYFENQLDDRFLSPHRSYLVNLNHIEVLAKEKLILSNGKEIPLSRRLAKKMQKAFIELHRGSAFYE